MRAVIAIVLLVGGVILLNQCGCTPAGDDDDTEPTPAECRQVPTLEQMREAYR